MSCDSVNKEELCKDVDLKHLINKLVGKLGENKVKKLLLNVTSNCLEEEKNNLVSDDDKVEEITNNKISNVKNKKNKFQDKKEADIQNFNTNQNKKSRGKEINNNSNQKSSSNYNFQEDSNFCAKSSNERRESLSKQKSNINRNLLSSFIEVDNLKQKNNHTCIEKESIQEKKSLDKSHVKQCKDSDLSNDLCTSHFTESVNTSNTGIITESNLCINMRIDKNYIDYCVNQSDYDTLNLSDKVKNESTKRKSKNKIEKTFLKNKEETISESASKSEICSVSSEPKFRKCELKKNNFVKNDKNLKRNNKPKESTDFSSLKKENLFKDSVHNEDALCESNISTENKSNNRKKKLKRESSSSEPRILRSQMNKPSCLSDNVNTCNYSTDDKKDKSNILYENIDISQDKQTVVEPKLSVFSDNINNEIEENIKSLQESANSQQNYKTELKEGNFKKNKQKNIGNKKKKEEKNESEQIVINKEGNFLDQQALDSNENLSASRKNSKKKILNENTDVTKFLKSKTPKEILPSIDEIQIINKEKNEIQEQCSDKSIEDTNLKMKTLLKIEHSIIVKPCSVILKKENLEKELNKIKNVSEEFSESNKRKNDLNKKKVKTFKNQENNNLNDNVTNNYSLELNQEKEETYNKKDDRRKIDKLYKNNNQLNLNISEAKDKSDDKNETKKHKTKKTEKKEECSIKKFNNFQSENDSVSLRKENSLDLQTEKLPINENEQTMCVQNLNNNELKIKDKNPDDKDNSTVEKSFEKKPFQDFGSEKQISVDKKNKIRKLRRLDINKKPDKYFVKQKSELIVSKESSKSMLENTIELSKNDECQKNKNNLKINEREENYMKEQFTEKVKHHKTMEKEVIESEFLNNKSEENSNNKIKDKIINSPDHQNLNLEETHTTCIKNKSSKSLEQLTELHSKIKCVLKSTALLIGKDSLDNETNEIDKYKNFSNTTMNSSKSVCPMEKDSSVVDSFKNINDDEHSSKVNENKRKHFIKFEEENSCKKKLKISKTEEQIISQSKQDIETDKTNKETKGNDILANKQNSVDISGPIQKRKLKRNNMFESKKNVQIKQNLSNSIIKNTKDNSSFPPTSLLPEEKTISNNMESNKTDTLTKSPIDKNTIDKQALKKSNLSETDYIKCKKKKLKDKPLPKNLNKKKVITKINNKNNILITKDLSDQSLNRKIVIIKQEPIKCNSAEKLKKSENTKIEINTNDDRNNNIMESSTDDVSNAIKYRDPKISKESIIAKPENIFNESSENINENLSCPSFSNYSQKSKIKKSIKESTKFKPKIKRKSLETISSKDFNDGSCDVPKYDSSKKLIIQPIEKESMKKSFETEDCENLTENSGHIKIENLNQDFITNKVNTDNNFEPLIVDIRQLSRNEWESSEKHFENTNASANSNENQDIDKLNNKTLYQAGENSDASNEETYDEYSDLREQFINAGIKLEDAVSFIDVKKLKEVLINAGNDSCVLLRRKHYCPYSKRHVGPSLIVVKSYKKYMEAKDAILCEKYGMKLCKVVLNELL